MKEKSKLAKTLLLSSVLALGTSVAHAKKKGTDVDPEGKKSKAAATTTITCTLFKLGCETVLKNPESEKAKSSKDKKG